MEKKTNLMKVVSGAFVLMMVLGVSLIAGKAIFKPAAASAAYNPDLHNRGDSNVESTADERPSNMYILFEGIEGEPQEGESQGQEDGNWSNIDSFSQGQSISNGTEGEWAGQLVFDDIKIVKPLDKLSPKLAEAVCTGRVFPTVEIHVTASVGSSRNSTYYAYELTNVRITSYSISGSAEGDIPIEQLSLNFGQIRVIYTEYDNSGRSKGDVEYTWTLGEGEL
jgi:type VI secretion system secreted protein Hcp